MSRTPVLRFSRPPAQSHPAWAGWLRLVELTKETAEAAGFDLSQTPSTREGPIDEVSYWLSFESDPFGAYGLVARHAHHVPFWQIDRVLAPWQLEVAQRRYMPGLVETREAEVFYHYWRDRIFGDAPYRTTKEGFALVTVEGGLERKAPGSVCTPIDMIKRCLTYEPDRQLVISLAPGETYPDGELAALRQIDEAETRVSVRIGDRKNLLRTCDYLVTQSGTAALDGYLFGKNPVLFARIDAHHIGLDVRKGTAAAFEAASQHAPNFANYVTWFLRDNAVNVFDEEALGMVTRRLIALGWPMAPARA